MVSELTPQGTLAEAIRTVLILVLVEDGLGAAFLFSLHSLFLFVLILVLVEDGLGDAALTVKGASFTTVLILVLVEDGLGAYSTLLPQ